MVSLGTSLGVDLCPRVAAFAGTPDTILSAGEQKGRYRADTGVTLNGSRLSGWSNMWAAGGDFAQATASNQPLYSATVMNGRAAVIADSTARIMTTAVMSSPIPTGQRAYVWCFCRLNSILTGSRYFVVACKDASSAPRVALGTTSGVWSSTVNDGVASVVVTAIVGADLNRHLFEGAFSAAGADVVISGKSRSAAGPGVTGNAINTIDLFHATGVINQGVAGAISEIVLMQGEPTAQQKLDMRSYFRTYYGTI